MANTFYNLQEQVAADVAPGTIVNADVSASAAIALSKLAAVTASRALVSDASGFVSAATTTSTEVGYLNGAVGKVVSTVGASGTSVTVNTTDSATQLFTFTPAAPILTSDDRWLVIDMPYQHTTDQNVTQTISITLNGISIFSLVSGTLGSGTRNGTFNARIRRDTGDTKTHVNGWFSHNGTIVTTNVATTNASINCAAAQAFVIRITHSVNAAAVGITAYGYQANLSRGS